MYYYNSFYFIIFKQFKNYNKLKILMTHEQFNWSTINIYNFFINGNYNLSTYDIILRYLRFHFIRLLLWNLKVVKLIRVMTYGLLRKTLDTVIKYQQWCCLESVHGSYVFLSHFWSYTIVEIKNSFSLTIYKISMYLNIVWFLLKYR